MSISFKEQKHRERRRKQRDSMRRLRAKRKAAKDYMNYLLAGGTPFVATPAPVHNNISINSPSTLHLYNQEEFDTNSLDINYIQEHAKRRIAFTNAVKDGERLYQLALERQYKDCSVDQSWPWHALQRKKKRLQKRERAMSECRRCVSGYCAKYIDLQRYKELPKEWDPWSHICITCFYGELKNVISATPPPPTEYYTSKYLSSIENCIAQCEQPHILEKKFGDIVLNDGARLLVDYSKLAELLLDIGIRWLKPRADGAIKQAGISKGECKAKVSDMFRRRSDHVLKRGGNVNEASLYADLAVHYNPTSMLANRQRGYAMHACGNTAQALVSFEKAVDANSECRLLPSQKTQAQELIEELADTRSKRELELNNLEEWKRSDRTYSSGISSSDWREICLEYDW